MEAVMTRKSVLGKNVLRNEKGLTLLELLAVIVILGIIAAIAIPSIGGIMKSTKTKAHYSNALMIIDAAKMKVTNELPITADGNDGDLPTADFELSKLVEQGFLDVKPADPDKKSQSYSDGTFVKVHYTKVTGKYDYTITIKRPSGGDLGPWTEDSLKAGNPNNGTNNGNGTTNP